MRSVSFTGPSAELFKKKGIPEADWSRIYRKIDDVRRGIRLKPLQHEDAVSPDGCPQFESKTHGANGHYRIYLKRTGANSYEVTDVNFRKNTGKRHGN